MHKDNLQKRQARKIIAHKLDRAGLAHQSIDFSLRLLKLSYTKYVWSIMDFLFRTGLISIGHQLYFLPSSSMSTGSGRAGLVSGLGSISPGLSRRGSSSESASLFCALSLCREKKQFYHNSISLSEQVYYQQPQLTITQPTKLHIIKKKKQKTKRKTTKKHSEAIQQKYAQLKLIK
jgi:hypothetical protein